MPDTFDHYLADGGEPVTEQPLDFQEDWEYDPEWEAAEAYAEIEAERAAERYFEEGRGGNWFGYEDDRY